MTEAQAIEAMTQRWIDAWPTASSSVPYTFRGETFDAVPKWARVTFRPTLRVQATMGRPARYEDRGVIFVQLFADVGLGEKPLVEMAGCVRTVFESLALSADLLVTFAATRRMGGDDGRGGVVVDDGRWVMSVVTIPYWFDEQR